MKSKGKKRLPYLKLSLFLILFLCQTARSTTYYVATTGSNSNPGSQLLPWLTIQYAANSVSAGDTVIVLSGIYNERVHLNNLGAPGQKIVYMAKPARTVYMQGFLVVAPYNSIEGFDIATQTSGWQGGGFWVAANYIDLINNSLHDIPGAGIQATWGASSNWSRNVYVAQNYFFHCDEGMDVEGYNWLIEDNEVERPLYAGLAGDYSRFFGDSITFRHNYFHGARISEVGGAHVDGFQYFDNNGEFATNIVIEGNYVESFDEGVILESTNTAGSTANIIIRNNVFIGGELGGAWGVCAKDNIRHGFEIVNNLFADLEFHGVGLQVNSEGIVQNNIFFDAGSNYWADATSLVQGGHNIINHVSYPFYADPTDLINTNPLMVDTLNFIGVDSLPFTCDDGYHLQSSSPAIDAGISTVAYGVILDIFGTVRPVGSGYDIGPVEYSLLSVNPSSNSPVCAGDTINLISNPTGGTIPYSYLWSGPNSFSSTVQNPTLTNASPAMSGAYTVAVTDAQGCIKPGITIVAVTPIPPKPSISLAGDTLVSNQPQGNQWYLNNVKIPGATGQTYRITQPGEYFDIISINGCSSDTSNSIEFIVGILEKQNPTFSISPVPNDGHFKMTIRSSIHGSYLITVYNIFGIRIFEANLEILNNISEFQVDLSPIPDGIYTVELRNNQTEIVKKFVKFKQ